MVSVASALSNIVYYLVALFPFAIFAIPNGGSLALIIFILSLFGLLFQKKHLALSKGEQYLIFSFLFYFVVQLLYFFIFNSELKDLDTPSRFILVLPIYFYIRNNPPTGSRFFVAIALSAIIAGLLAVYQYYFTNMYEAKGFIENGSFALIVSIYTSVCLFMLITKRSDSFKPLFALAFVFGLTAVVLSNIRGVWIALLVSNIYWLMSRRIVTGKALLTILILGVTVVSLLFPNIVTRTNLALSHVSQYVSGVDVDHSVGHRLEMYKSSWLIMKDNPFGIGENNYTAAKDEQIKIGEISQFVAHHAHPHSEYITSFIEQGVLGFVSLLLVLFVPLRFFINRFNKSGSDFSIVGVYTVLNYAIFAIFSGIFDHQVSTLFYALFVVIIYSLINRERLESS